MRFLTLILLIGGLAVFFLQNRQPVALVFLGGVLKVQLPLAGWVLLFVAAGALTSLFLQALNALRGLPPSRARGSSPESYQPPSPPPRPREIVPPSQGTESARSPAAMPPPSPVSEWQPQETREEWDDWNLEEAPAKPRAREPVNTRIQEKIQEQEIPNLEVQQEPQRFSREGSVYSYSYREREPRESLRRAYGERPPETAQETPQEIPQNVRNTEKSESHQRDRVYDANYRIITPPYRDDLEFSPQKQEEDEEWV